ncbi:uncharacterized protein LOC109832116 isoform X2 [Asparagus officinalis]|uniref:uncharacterized protein LOC109832116 isoform X2 n=1 Tax=Asparagus officinalis TaxID=4686 RepID=UPI00098E6844|nr:uncharacterized protein LOC109832116 isoform X2 [Asparagus officinalis]
MASYGVALHFNHTPSSKYLATKSNFQAKAEKTVSFVTTEKQKEVSLKEIGLQRNIESNIIASLAVLIRRAPREILKPPDTKTIRWAEIVIDQAIINCRFFTLIPVVGTLVGSILCFVEGCFLMLESYIEGFHIVTQNLDHGRMVEMVIEGIDVFLVGTAMLTFGLGLYSMFIGLTTSSGLLARGSNRSTLFHPKEEVPLKVHRRCAWQL